MSNLAIVLASSAALLLTSAASAQTSSAVAAADEKETKIICKTMHVVGSRIAQKNQCATKKQWEDRAYRDRKVLEQMQTNTLTKE